MANDGSKSFIKITLIWVMVSILVFIILMTLGVFLRSVQSDMFGSAQAYFYPAMTLHGIGMAGLWYIASMAMTIYISTRFVRPGKAAQIFALICTLLGVVLLIVATLVGKFAAGWYFLYPLPFFGTWPGWATQFFLVGIAILGVGWLIWNLDFLRAISRQYKLGNALGWQYIKGGADPEVPPFITITTVSSIVCLACLVSGVAVLLFYFVELFTGRQNDALMMKNLTFFFGHVLVNLSMYLGVAVVYEILPEYTKRTWKNNKLIALAWNFVLIVVLVAYFHHLYMDFAQPLWVQYAGQIASYVSSIPAAVMSIFGALALTYRSQMKWNLTSSFLFLGLLGWAIGGIGAVIDSTISVNERFHNTLWVPAHFHTYTLVGLVLIVLGYYYHLVHNINGKEQKPTLSLLIVALYLIGGYGVVAAFYVAGADSVPRRFSTYNYDFIRSGVAYAKTGLVFSLLVLAAVLIYFTELVRNWLQAFKNT